MPTPSAILATAAGVYLNDSLRQLFTDANMLPHLNQALSDMEEAYQLNDIPVTHATSDIINVPLGSAGVTKIGLQGTVIQLPPGFIELKELWESAEGQNNWTPVTQKDFLPQYYLNGTQIGQFLIYSWQNDEINLITANQDNDLKLDYIRKLFNPIVAGNLNIDLGLKFDKCASYLAARTAALAAMYVGENPERAKAIEDNSVGPTLETAISIALKGQQSIATRRRPFRASYKSQGLW